MRPERSGQPSASPSLRVLLIDDHEVTRAACRALLRTEGVNVVADLSVREEALALAHELRPDAVVVDLCPEGEHGLALARRLRGLGGAPTVVLTSSAARNRFGAQLDRFPFVAKADLCTARLHDAIHATTEGGTMHTSTSRNPVGAVMARQQIDTLIEAHYRAEVKGDLQAIVDGFTPDAAHDVAGRPGGPIHGGDGIAMFYRGLLAELRIERFETVHRRYGRDHATDESILHATAIGRPFGVDGHGRRIAVRILHVFDFAEGLISRESAWLDLASLHEQLAA